MRRKRSRSADAAAKRHKSAKRQIKNGHRFVQYSEPSTGTYYEDTVTGKSYPGVMPPMLKAYRVERS